MYNRYVPPPKPRSQPAQSSPRHERSAPSDATNSATQAGAPTSTTPYARYVPPRKPKASESAQVAIDALSPATKRKHDASVNGVDSPTSESKKPKTSDAGSQEKKQKKHNDRVMEDESTVDNGDQLSGDKKKKKKKGKESKRKDSSPEDLASGNVEATDGGMTEILESKPDGDEAEDRNEEKRDKPKKKKKREQPDQDDNDAAPSRHVSVLAKKAKSLQKAPEASASNPLEDGDGMEVDAQEELEDVEMHGLEPLPQPAPVALDTSKPTYETLPSWLAAPIRVGPDKRTPFSEMGINLKACKALDSKGFKDAFAVQTAAIPLLLPSCKHRQGDLLVAAATGSGKTLAYALPIVRDISQGMVTRLRALVVLPTRELVNQAHEVFELCAGAFDGRDQKRVRVGTSIGSQQLKHDQANLVEKTERYDPEAYRAALRRDRQAWKSVDESESESDDQSREHVLGSLPDHVVDYDSKVDILICTPGRLVDHINHTPGLSLDYARWLVVDEADKLLAQSFQGWLGVVMPKLRRDRFSARDFPGSNLTGVRKVILSATLTRDLSLLGGLQLRRPQLIVLEGDRGGGNAQVAEHTLPHLLKEFAIRVYNPSLKPVYLLDLLQGEHLLSPAASASAPPRESDKKKISSDDTSSEDESDTSSSGSDDTSSSESESESEAPRPPKTTFDKTVLIFTKSNESALRLSRLLSLLAPPLSPLIGTLTSTQKTSHRRRILSAFSASASGNRRLRILVASDLVARGIDLPALDNVVNYDLPASAAGYVHRVGRTARAGRQGRAFTLVETRETGWFWGAVGKWTGIRRAEDVGRLKIGESSKDDEEGYGGFGKEKVEAYQKALEELGREAGEVRKTRR